MTAQKKQPDINKEMTKVSQQHFDESYGLKPPENYERYFVPAIGEPLANDLIRRAALRPGEKVLDVACGTGIVARLAAEKVGASGTVTGLDVNPGMLAVARSIASPDESIEWLEANAEVMPLPDEAFDVVLCQLSLQFMEDKVGALREIRRVLRPDGRLLLNVPGPRAKPFTVLAAAMERNISSEAARFVNHVFSLHDITEIQRLMNEAEFQDTAVHAYNKVFHLPPPKKFLWQYVHSTPLAGVVAKASKEALISLEREVIEKWEDHKKNGSLMYQQRIVVVDAR